MSKSQEASQIAAEQMFTDIDFWDEVEDHLKKRTEGTDNARLSTTPDTTSVGTGIAGAPIRSAY